MRKNCKARGENPNDQKLSIPKYRIEIQRDPIQLQGQKFPQGSNPTQSFYPNQPS